MSMNLLFVNILVICVTILQAAPKRTGAPQTLDPALHREAYEIYATLIPRLWAQEKGVPLLQQETEPSVAAGGCTILKTQSGDWADAAADFQRQNAHPWTLQPGLPIPYQFIRRAKIQADDARLKQEYPAQWQVRPGSIQYAAVSAVGFNRDRTKAIVDVHLRTSGFIVKLELKDGEWRPVGEGCTWMV